MAGTAGPMEVAARALFAKAFADGDGKDVDELVCVAAPGRVNLIGEHTDYNDGFVMPLALEQSTVCVIRLREDGSKKCRIVSAYEPETTAAFTLDESSDSLVPGKDESWARYVKGVIKQYVEEIFAAKPVAGQEREAVGFDAAFASDVPLGGGLSSSASLEVCTAAALEELYGITTVDKVQRALRCVEAEHTFANVPCGIMDQFISSCAVEGCLLLIDCRSRGTVEVPMSDPSICVLVTNSNVKHELSGSEYPDRVRQCKEALAAINKVCGEIGASGAARTHLRDATLAELEQAKAAGAMDEVVYRRGRHAISEDERATTAAKAAQSNDYIAVGKLMFASHASLRDDYEVSIPEIDFLVEAATALDGVLGSRITGGGFGGCTVSLVETAKVEAVQASLAEQYRAKFGVECTCFATKLGPGARVITPRADEGVQSKKQRLE